MKFEHHGGSPTRAGNSRCLDALRQRNTLESSNWAEDPLHGVALLQYMTVRRHVLWAELPTLLLFFWSREFPSDILIIISHILLSLLVLAFVAVGLAIFFLRHGLSWNRSGGAAPAAFAQTHHRKAAHGRLARPSRRGPPRNLIRLRQSRLDLIIMY